jgi:hypothetical protein
MKRTRSALPLLLLPFLLALTSCDQMFNSNLFAKLTHPTPSVADIAQKSPDQLLQYVTSSAANVQTLADNPDLKAAALQSLSTTYKDASATAVDQQTAALAAAVISIQTVPAAAELTTNLVSAIVNQKNLSTATTADVSALVQSILPSDIAASVGAPTPPAAFVAMIEAYTQANAAYTALGNGVVSGGGFAAGVDLGSSGAQQSATKNDIAMNAIISGLVAAIVVPPNSSDSTATALWNGLNGDTTAFTVPSASVDALTKSPATNPIASLVNASDLGAKIGSSL